MNDFLKKTWNLYYEGFRDMTIGKTLWAIIIVKLAIMFLILKPFFFKSEFKGLDDRQIENKVSMELIDRMNNVK